MGRYVTSTPEIIDAICARIADGESLRAICLDDDMPGRRTVLDWLEADESFRAKYARAREAQADVMDDRILQVADACTVEDAAAARVKIDAYKWRAAKLKPKVYGDKLQTEHSGTVTQALDLSNLDPAQLRALASIPITEAP